MLTVPPRHIDEILRFRSRKVGGSPLRIASRDLRKNLPNIARRDGLNENRRHGRHIALTRPPDQHAGEFMELRVRWIAGSLQEPGENQFLLNTLADVVRITFDPIQSHNRQQHVMPDSRGRSAAKMFRVAVAKKLRVVSGSLAFTMVTSMTASTFESA